MSNLVIKIAANSKAYASELKKVGKQTEDLERQLSSVAKVSGAAFVGFAGSIGLAVSEAAKFEKINAQFQVLTGNIETANKLVGELSDFSAKTPFKFEDIATAGKTLLSFGFEASEVRSRLQEIGDVAAATGTPFKDLSVIFGQIQAAGKLTAERLNQLQERAVPIGPELARVLGIAETELRDAVSKGQVSAQDFQKAFANLSKEGGLAFKGLEKSSETFNGVLSTLQDNFSLLIADIGKAFLPVLKTLSKNLIDLLQFIKGNPALVDAAVQTLKWGAAITGIITTVSAFALGVIKVSGVIAALTAAFGPAALGASAFWAALTGPVGIAIAAIAAVTAAAFKLFNVFQDEKAKKAESSIEGLNEKLEEQKKKLKEANDLAAGDSRFKVVAEERKKAINEEIARLEALKQKKIEADQAQGKKEEQKEEGEGNKEKKKTEIVSAEIAKRIELAKQEQEILRAQQEGATQQEIEFLERRQELKNEEAEANKIRNEELKNLELDNIRTKQDQLLEEERAFTDRRRDQEAEIREEDAEILAEIEEMRKEAKTQKDQEEIDALQNQLLTKKEAEQQVNQDILKEEIKSRNQRLKDEVQYGKAYAALNQALYSKEVEGARQAAGQLVQLNQSKNNTLKSIGKAAALSQIGIDTGRGAIAAYSSLAGIPLIGPALGAAAAAAIIAFGAEQASQVLAANKGGRVPGNLAGARPGQDSVNALLTPGELVVPDRNFDEVVNAVASSRSGGGQNETSQESGATGGTNNQITISGDILDNDEFVDNMIEKMRDKILFENADIGVE